MNDPTKPMLVSVELRPDLSLRLKIKNSNNHLLRNVLIGLWARLDAADRRDFMVELEHYAPLLETPADYPGRHLPGISALIAGGERDATVVDFEALIGSEHDLSRSRKDRS